MIHRNLGDIGRYGDPSVRKMVPLAIALSSISNPQLQLTDILTKYSHDPDDEVAANAIFSLGMVGAGEYLKLVIFSFRLYLFILLFR